MKNIFILLFLLILTGLLSRSPAQELEITGKPKEIKIDLKSPVERYHIGAVTIQKIIRLETSPESIIGNFGTTMVRDEKIFILDKDQKKILVFDIKGNFLNSIGQVGGGPGELILPMDFDFVGEKQEIAVLDNMKKSILVFNFEGKFLYKIHHNLRVTRLAFRDNGFWLFCGKMENMEYGSFELYFIDMTGQVNKSAFKINEDFLDTGFGSLQGHNIFWHLKDKLFFCHMFDNNIYEITNNEILKHSYLDFGKYNIPEGIAYKLITDINYLNKVARLPSDYVWGVSSLEEIDDYIFLWIGGGFTHYYIYYSKKDNTYKQVPAVSPFDPFSPGRPLASYNNMFLNYMYSHNIVKRRSEIIKLITNDNHIKILNEVNETDNPIFLVVKPNF